MLTLFYFLIGYGGESFAMMSAQLAMLVSGPNRNNPERLGNTFPGTHMRGWAAGYGFGNHHRDERCSCVSGRVYYPPGESGQNS